jgi:hypothetical protein
MATRKTSSRKTSSRKTSSRMNRELKKPATAARTISATMNREATTVEMDVSMHRRILTFLNEAVRPEDLIYEKLPLPNPELDPIHEDNPEEHEPKRNMLTDPKIARAIFDYRDLEYPLGFRNLKEVLELEPVTRFHLESWFHHFSNQFFGRWSVFPRNIPRRGTGGCGRDDPTLEPRRHESCHL